MKKDILLCLDTVTVLYGGVAALNRVSITIDEGEIVALMGPNGAGKSTVIKALMGLAPLSHGVVRWHDAPIVPTPESMVKRGVAYVPQGRQIFMSLTVRENLEIGGVVVSDRLELARRIAEVLELFPVLAEKLRAPASTLSGGQQQMLALARGLMTDPKVLLLDEPTLGLSPKLVKEIFAKIREINERHKTAILVVEHNIKSLLAVAHRAYVLEKGKVVADMPSADLIAHGALERAFLAAETRERATR